MATTALQYTPHPSARNTVYAQNLNDRIKPPALKEALEEIFSEYGTILEIVAKTNLKAKGQAFIVFDDSESATNAIEEVNGFELFGKEMKLDFARTRSDRTVEQEEGEEGLQRWKEQRNGIKERRRAAERKEVDGSAQGSSAGAQAGQKRGAVPVVLDSQRPAKLTKGAGLKSSTANASNVIPDEYLPPNKILFVRDIPDSYDKESLARIFGRFEGFKEIRTVPGRKGIAFVEYEAETGAINAKDATSGMQLGDEGVKIRVTYQRG